MPRRRRPPSLDILDFASDRTPLERAQELIYEAMVDAPTEKRRVALAREALALSADCADAYLILSEDADTVHDAHALLLDAVAAGERALDGQLESLVRDGLMWLALESRPYMRALAMLATFEWEMGDRQPAIARGWELLRLNPGDNQGMRYEQLHRLLVAGSLEQIDRLLALYPDDHAAAWAFGRALHLYRTRGIGPDSDAALRDAKRANHHVVPFLLVERVLPDESPEFIALGEESEAVAYAWDALVLWAETPGALDWLELKRGPSGARGTARGRRKR
jgi:hypothetical protein